MTFFFFPLHKVACNATTTCNSHGSCTDDGNCQCDNGFYAANCSGKLFFESFNHPNIFWNFKYFAWIVECDAAQSCSGQGICGTDGACQCEATFYGENCISKIDK